MGFEVETWIPDCSYWVQRTLHPHWKPSYRKNMIMQHQGYHSWTSSWILEHWHPIWQSQSLYQSSVQSTYNSSHWYSKLMFPLHFILFILLYQPCFSSTLQLSTYLSPLLWTHPWWNQENQWFFQPVLQAYPTRHSWIVTAHISLGYLEQHWKLFKRATH